MNQLIITKPVHNLLIEHLIEHKNRALFRFSLSIEYHHHLVFTRAF